MGRFRELPEAIDQFFGEALKGVAVRRAGQPLV